MEFKIGPGHILYTENEAGTLRCIYDAFPSEFLRAQHPTSTKNQRLICHVYDSRIHGGREKGPEQNLWQHASYYHNL